MPGKTGLCLAIDAIPVVTCATTKEAAAGGLWVSTFSASSPSQTYYGLAPDGVSGATGELRDGGTLAAKFGDDGAYEIESPGPLGQITLDDPSSQPIAVVVG